MNVDDISKYRGEVDYRKRLATEDELLAAGNLDDILSYAFEILDGRWHMAEDQIVKSNKHKKRYLERFNMLEGVLPVAKPKAKAVEAEAVESETEKTEEPAAE